MKRFGQLVLGVAFVIGAAGTSAAQATAAPERLIGAQATVAATLGNKSDTSFGAEGTYRLNEEWEVFAEVGRMGNVASGTFEDSVQLILEVLPELSPNVIQSAVFFDAGMRYRLLPIFESYEPFVALGFGIARVTGDVSFSVDGRQLSEGELLDQYGLELGDDFAGSVTKPFLTIGGGVTRAFATRYFMEVSYRYGRIFARSSVIPDDSGTNTQRAQFGIGIRF
jgi:hypothetical protein